MHAKSLYSLRSIHKADTTPTTPAGEVNPQPAQSSVGNAQYDCYHYSGCLGIAADHGWPGLSCEACTVFRPIPGEAIPDDACAQLLGAILRTAQHDLQQGFDDNFWEAAAFVFHQPDFVILCGLLDIDPEAARQAHWARLTSAQKQAITDRWPQVTETFH